ncbi:MAG: hypothetical protein FWF41_08350 [Betaproteobacteria bacterium]|nr:hypothetical protein [Betaproteobacteria bacterium]
MSRAKSFLLLACAVVFTGCAIAPGQGIWDFLVNGSGGNYRKYYKPAPEMTSEEIAKLRAAPPTEIPIVENAQYDNRDEAIKAAADREYAEIGRSFFEQCSEYKIDYNKDASVHARLIGSDLGLVFVPKYLNKTESWTEAIYEDVEVYDGTDSNGKPQYHTESRFVRNEEHTCYWYDCGAVFFIKKK